MVAQPLRELPTLIILFFAQTAKIRMVHFSQLWQFVQWLCDQWQIVAVLKI
jgi:hypothetical protein